MSPMIATNIRLPEDLLKALKYRAIEERKSVNQMIREAIELSLVSAKGSKEPEEDAFEGVIGIASSGAKDGALMHDNYLYGKKE